MLAAIANSMLLTYARTRFICSKVVRAIKMDQVIGSICAPRMCLPCKVWQKALHDLAIWEAGDEHQLDARNFKKFDQLCFASNVNRTMSGSCFHQEKLAAVLHPHDEIGLFASGKWLNANIIQCLLIYGLTLSACIANEKYAASRDKPRTELLNHCFDENILTARR